MASSGLRPGYSSPGGDAIGPNPTDRGKAGSKRSLLVEGHPGPLSLVVAGANVHDTKLLEATLAAIVVERPQPTDQAPQHLCLDKGYDNPTGHQAAAAHGYQAHIRRVGEEKLRSLRREYPSGPTLGGGTNPVVAVHVQRITCPLRQKGIAISWVFCNWPAEYCATGEFGALLF